MAYTYDDFTKAAGTAGLTFDQADLDIARVNPEYGISLVKLTQDVNGASTPEQKLLAQEAVNQLRKSYGGMTSAVGSAAGGSFSYGKQNEYQQLLDKVTNRDPFQYDTDKDPVFGQYRKTYLREADRAREDTLAKVSAMSGGRPSSYAVGAAQQAGNYYVGQLNDKVPELEQNAFQRYMNNYSTDLSALQAMSADREFDFNAYLQQYAEKQQEWNNALTMYNMGFNTPEIRKILGIPEPVAVPQGGGGGGDNRESSYRNPNPGTEETIEEEWASGIDETRNQSGLKGSSWDYTLNNLKKLVNSGNKTKVEEYMDKVSGQMNEKQYKQAVALFKK